MSCFTVMSTDHHPLRFLQYMRSYIVQKVIEHSLRHISQRFCNHRVANVYILQIQYHISFTWQKKVSSRLSSVYWILGVDCCIFECTNVAVPLDIYKIEIPSSLFPPSLFNLHISSKHFKFWLFFHLIDIFKSFVYLINKGQTPKSPLAQGSDRYIYCWCIWYIFEFIISICWNGVVKQKKIGDFTLRRCWSALRKIRKVK